VPFSSQGLAFFSGDVFQTGTGQESVWIAGASGAGAGSSGSLVRLDPGTLHPSNAVLPAVSQSWELRAVRVRSDTAGIAVGNDMALGRGVALNLTSGLSWQQMTLPDVSDDWMLLGLDLSGPDDGWAVGADVTTGQGVILRLTNGVFSVVQVPAVSGDWALFAVKTMPNGTAWAVGEDFATGQGVILSFTGLEGVAGGGWHQVALPRVSGDWGLRSVDFPSASEGWAAGRDNENGRGVMLRLMLP